MSDGTGLVSIDRKHSMVPAEPGLPVPVDAGARGRDEKLDRALDEALEETFPASDPVAITAPGHCS